MKLIPQLNESNKPQPKFKKGDLVSVKANRFGITKGTVESVADLYKKADENGAFIRGGQFTTEVPADINANGVGTVTFPSKDKMLAKFYGYEYTIKSDEYPAPVSFTEYKLGKL